MKQLMSASERGPQAKFFEITEITSVGLATLLKGAKNNKGRGKRHNLGLRLFLSPDVEQLGDRRG